MTGHLLGGAGGVEAIFTILTLYRGIIPPTINYETPDRNATWITFPMWPGKPTSGWRSPILSASAARTRPSPSRSLNRDMKIALGCDHAGFELKEDLRDYLAELKIDALDLGTHGPQPVDYPDVAGKVVEKIARGEVEKGS